MNGESGKKLSRIRVEKMCESRSTFCMTIANAYTRISKIIVCCVSMDGVFFGADSQRRKRKRNGTKRIFRGKKRNVQNGECSLHTHKQTRIERPKRIHTQHKRQHADSNVSRIAPVCIHAVSKHLHKNIFFRLWHFSLSYNYVLDIFLDIPSIFWIFSVFSILGVLYFMV